MHCVSLGGEAGMGIGERYQAYAGQLLGVVQQILKRKGSGKVLVQLVIPNWGEQQTLFGLAGLLKTAQLENPRVRVQVLGMEAEEGAESIVSRLQGNRESGRR